LAVTTLLNPKALVFGLVLLPGSPSILASFAVFGGAVLTVSALWLALGARLSASAKPLVNKLGAVWLAALSLLLIGRALAF
jgi:threonine/homoserine/homoserine lactone efflux protein